MSTTTTTTKNTVFFVLLFVSVLYSVSAQQRPSNISLGSVLTPTTNSTWPSRSGLYAFGFYPRKTGGGYSVGVFMSGIPENTVVWTFNRDDPPLQNDSSLFLTDDGELILQGMNERKAILVNTSRELIRSATMLDSGNFVLYNTSGGVIWQSFDNPTDTILPGQRLSANQMLVSRATGADESTGNFVLIMQGDGNLVQYPLNGPYGPSTAYYATNTGGVGDEVTLNFDDEGTLYLMNGTAFLRNIGTTNSRVKSIDRNSIFMMKIDPDGIFRIYSHPGAGGSWSASGESSSDRCSPKGLCGLNGFCMLLDEEPVCRCLPGFDFLKPANPASGCRRNFTAKRCEDFNETSTSLQFTMKEEMNTIWEDLSYSKIESLTKEECQESCLEDCNCEAALFKDGSCMKQGLPLRYGRRKLDDTSTTLVKVGAFSPSFVETSLKDTKNETKWTILIIGISLTVFAFFMIVISLLVVYKSYFREYRSIPGNVELCEDVAPRVFSYAELEKITNGFSEELGRGAFGIVFKGILQNNNQERVAVKRLDKELADGEREFQTEIKVIGRTHHKNLLRLVGYCLEGSHRLLVYEYMSNGSLADTLYKPEDKPSFDARIGIARDIARGILYLHEECETQIIHCDIKPQNILMDDLRRPKICDFGLAKLLKQDQTKTFTNMRGTKGYVAPEWQRRLPITVKADVYSFGIVLMEIICCRKSLDWSLDEEEAVLEEWVYGCFNDRRLGKLVVDEEVELEKIERMVKIAIWCIQDEPSLRPTMKKVLLMLEATVDIPVPPSPISFLSTA